MSERPRIRRIARALAWALVAGGALSLLALAAVPGIPTIDFGGSSRVPCLAVEGGREYWARAGCVGFSRIGGYSALVHFNELGIRDGDRARRPAPGTLRILVLGSTNALGLGVEEQHTVPRQLEERLRERGLRVEVINASMSGYCTIQSTFRFRELLARYSPGLVLYLLPLGSCPLADAAWADRVVARDGEPLRLDRTPFPRLPAALNEAVFRRPGLFFLWLTVADQLRKARVSWRMALATSPRGAETALLEATLRHARYLRREAAARGAPLVLAAYPVTVPQQSIPAPLRFGVARVLSRLVLPLRAPDARALARRFREEGFAFLLSGFDPRPYAMLTDELLTAEGAGAYARVLADDLSAEPPLRALLRKFSARP